MASRMPLLEFQTCALPIRSEEHTSELQSPWHLGCRLLLEIKRSFLSRSLSKSMDSLENALAMRVDSRRLPLGVHSLTFRLFFFRDRGTPGLGLFSDIGLFRT